MKYFVNNRFLFAASLAILLLLTSCKKEAPATVSPAVYVAGVQYINSIQTAVYWVNGVATPLPGNNHVSSVANAIYVDGSTVYSSGTEYGPTGFFATSWSNNKPTYLTNEGSGNAIFVAGKDVYVAGNKNNNATYWKNGTAVTLDGAYSIGLSIYVSPSDVYTAGYKVNNGYRAAMYWKNGVATNLTDPNDTLDCEANSVFVAGGDVYVAGGIGTTAAYWKNGTLTRLTPGSSNAVANSIYVAGNDVYVAGTADSVATYWKNGVPVPLTAITPYSARSVANAIVVFNNDVYVAGNQTIIANTEQIACYWKNGTVNNLTANSVVGYATAIYVK